MNCAPDVHDDKVAALRPVDAHKSGRLVVLLVQAGVLRTLPPAVGALEDFELQTPFASLPVSADLPAIPGPMHERSLEQRRAARGRDRPHVALGPGQNVPGQSRRLAHCQVVR